MTRRTFVKGAVTALPTFAGLGVPSVPASGSTGSNSAQGKVHVQAPARELAPITLPKPEKDGGKSVLASLQDSRTTRDISPDPLPPQALSNLLWAAFGVNRPEGGLWEIPDEPPLRPATRRKSTFTSSSLEGVYLYEAVPHRLAPVVAGDFRARSGRLAAVTAPVNIFFVADLARYIKEGQPDPHIDDPEVQKSYYYVDTGLIAANIYLFAASQGLAAWFHNCDKENTAKEFKLRPEQRVLFAQTVGYPKKP